MACGETQIPSTLRVRHTRLTFSTSAPSFPSPPLGNAIYDFFIGRELNPRIGHFDLKVFCELRPGLIGWVVLNLSYLFKYHVDGTKDVNVPLLLVLLFQGWYVLDSFISEVGGAEERATGPPCQH